MGNTIRTVHDDNSYSDGPYIGDPSKTGGPSLLLIGSWLFLGLVILWILFGHPAIIR